MGDCDIGLIGLAVMGENLVLNLESKGFKVAVFNRTSCEPPRPALPAVPHQKSAFFRPTTAAKVDAFVAGRGHGKRIVGCRSYAELAAALQSPRKVMVMVKAGFVRCLATASGGSARPQRSGRRDHCRAREGLRERRYYCRRRQFALSRHAAPLRRARQKGPARTSALVDSCALRSAPRLSWLLFSLCKSILSADLFSLQIRSILSADLFDLFSLQIYSLCRSILSANLFSLQI